MTNKVEARNIDIYMNMDMDGHNENWLWHIHL